MNLGDSRVYINNSDFSMTDSEGKQYEIEVFDKIRVSGRDKRPLGLVRSIAPNRSTEGFILFTIPKDAKGLKLIYDFSSTWSGTNSATWELD